MIETKQDLEHKLDGTMMLINDFYEEKDLNIVIDDLMDSEDRLQERYKVITGTYYGFSKELLA